MEQEIIPTRYKSKIPHTLSYPIGAKVISAALLGVPQFSELSIEFRYWNQLARHHGTATPYRVIEGQFRGPSRFFLASKRPEAQIYYMPRWTVTVDAVPRPLRHLIQLKITAEALPSIRSWLIGNYHSTEREGGHSLTFSFDELKSELTCNEHASLEWQTEKVED